ncbi:2-iminoacetate synthase ThiH, partial [bacterium]|nr:2-iminoacetate synthase ThiH [bacterium]
RYAARQQPADRLPSGRRIPGVVMTRAGSFAEIFETLDRGAIAAALDRATGDDVRASLSRGARMTGDAIALFSPAAAELLEPMAQSARAVTERRFGKVIQLYAPLYLSNECANVCTYCGFSADVEIPRVSLSPDQAVREAEYLREQGFRHILLLTGEMRGHYNVADIAHVASRLRGRFASIGIEVFPMSRDEYRMLADAGIDALTLYQETYHPDVYSELHTKGPKSRFAPRFRAVEAGGDAGFRSLGVGALLGLAPWRVEAVLLARHAAYLTRRFWKSRIAISFPRVNAAECGFAAPHPVSDADLAQMIVGMRLLFPDADLVLSTREPAMLRDNLVALGVTRMSAGSRTNPGGYATLSESESGEQFEISDERTADEVARMLKSRGFEPVWKDFDPAFLA